MGGTSRDLPAGYGGVIERLLEPLSERIATSANHPAFVVGLCGTQGSGKTTAARVLTSLLSSRGLTAVILSQDDLYLPLKERRRLAAEVHPLFKTRGVPGTHDIALGVDLLKSLARSGETLVPRFDKAIDDRLPKRDWTRVQGPVDVVLFEGWCVGATPEDAAALATPVNTLERAEDPDGVWRRYANSALAGPYRGLFAAIDLLVLLAAPSFDVVLGWRIQQEHELRAERGADAGMSDVELARFIRHYERLTRHILAEMPARADVVARLGQMREIESVTFR
jgi:D-glycerate 3-kinase